MSEFGPLEAVHVENLWYDGPREGIADIQGQPHRFVSQFEDDRENGLDTYLVWPAAADEFALEQEQWRIWLRWDAEHKAGRVGDDSHPGHPGNDARWDEIEALLKPRREVPATARRARARMEYREGDQPDEPIQLYRMAWQFV